MATRAERRTTVGTEQVDTTPTAAAATDLFFDLVDSLKAEQRERRSLVARLRASVEEGDRRLAALGIELPATTR